jgi:hypothetical protein
MLNNDDRNAIQGLFRRLKDVERRAAPRDPEAEALIRDEIARQPGAPYYMAQTVLVQEQALELAQQRIAELEAESRGSRRTDPFGGLFGRGGSPRAETPAPQRGPWDRDASPREGGRGGFLAGAAQTALGVTGGMLLGSAIAGMFEAGAAQAAEPAADPGADAGDNAAEPESDFGDSGGDGFDFGGDF